MNHRQFAKKFKSLVDRINNHAEETSQDSYEFYCKLRSCAEDGGRLLRDTIESNVVVITRSYSPWLQFTLSPDDAIQFTGFKLEDMISTEGPPLCFNEAVQTMALLQREYARNKSDLTTKDVERFLNRHIFLEAASIWLPEQYPSELKSLMDTTNFIYWKNETKKGAEIEFVSDYVPNDRHKDTSEEIIPNGERLAELYIQTCDVLVQHIDEFTQALPDKVITGFQSSFEKFKDINNRYSGTGKLHKDLLRELYAEASKAGVLLIMGIRSNLIIEPKNQPPWLHHSIRNTRTRFIGYESTHGVSTSFSPANFYELIKSFIGPESVMYCFEKTCKSEDECTAYLYRHVFFEAVTDWLPTIFPGQVSVVSLPEWEVETSVGDTISFISTWSDCRHESEDVSFATELLLACRDACNVLKECIEDVETAAHADVNSHTADNKSELTSSETDIRGKIIQNTVYVYNTIDQNVNLNEKKEEVKELKINESHTEDTTPTLQGKNESQSHEPGDRLITRTKFLKLMKHDKLQFQIKTWKNKMPVNPIIKAKAGTGFHSLYRVEDLLRTYKEMVDSSVTLIPKDFEGLSFLPNHRPDWA